MNQATEEPSKELLDELLAECGVEIQKLIFAMVRASNRRGTMSVRPAVDGKEAPYVLRFDVCVTLVDDPKPRATKAISWRDPNEGGRVR